MSFSIVSLKKQEAARNTILILKEIASSPSIRIPDVGKQEKLELVVHKFIIKLIEAWALFNFAIFIIRLFIFRLATQQADV